MDTAKKLEFKCVPLLPIWTTPGTKLDLKAIYRRPRRRTGEFDEVINETAADGRPLWDLTSALPLRRHSDYLAKGFEYVTLADLKSLEDAAQSLRNAGIDPRQFMQHPHFGPWNPKLFAATAEATDVAQYQELLALVDQFGVDAVEQIRKAPLPEAVKKYVAEKHAASTTTSSGSTSYAASNVPAGGETTSGTNILDRAVTAATPKKTRKPKTEPAKA